MTRDATVSTDIVLKKIGRARDLLAEARDAKSAKRVVDIAYAAEIYAKRQKLSQESIDYAHEIKTEALRLLGEYLSSPATKAAGTRGLGRPRIGGTRKAPPKITPTLSDIGISKKESSLSQKLAKLAKEKPASFEAVKRGEKTYQQATTEERREERVRKWGKLAKPKLGKRLGTFQVLLADPPWRYEHTKTESRAIENQYPTMSLDEIRALPAERVASKDSVLFLWATAPKLAEAVSVIEAWGFNYRSCIVWDKEKIGMGYYARQQHELLLIATRGQPPAPAPKDRPASVVRIRRGQHSAKPARFYELIERMYPKTSRVELFARGKRKGWKVWGAEAPK